METTTAATTQPGGGGQVIVGGDVTTLSTTPELGLQLTDGQPTDGEPDAPQVVEGDPLPDDQADEILDRLPDAPDDDGADDDGFDRPADSLKPPLVGNTIDTPFPPNPGSPPDPSDPIDEPLDVVRFQPEGDVALAPFLSVTFNQPMVPLGTVDQLAEEDVPLDIEPAIDGRWRWIGTRTLRFELEPGPIDRLPAATEYVATVPAGTTSASGNALSDDITWSFATPAPIVTSFTGESDSLTLEPVFVAAFDQRVEPDAVLETISLLADGDETEIRLATDDEIESDEDARQSVAAAQPDRTVAFRPVDPLDADTPLSIQIGPGTPSAEGPRLTESSTTYSAHTYPALRVTDRRCGFGDGCEPLSPIVFEFSNPLDTESFVPDLISIEPAIPGLRVNLFGSVMELTGATAGRTTYEITLASGLRDVFGQTLGEDQTFEFEIGPAIPTLRGLDRQFITTDPAAEAPSVSIFSVNHERVRVTAWSVEPSDYPDFLRLQEQIWSDAGPLDPDWPEAFADEVEIDAEEDVTTETVIDLGDAFAASGDAGKGSIVVLIESTLDIGQNDDRYWRNQPSIAWVQSTDLGVDVIFDNDELLVWTTDLLTGEPIGNVDVQLLGTDTTLVTDDDGLARTPFESRVRGVLAITGDRVAHLPSSWFEGWEPRTPDDEARWYVFDDRGIYRPGETVRLAGWVRRFAASDDAQLALYDDELTVTYQAWDPQGNELGDGEVEINALGGFNLTIDLPEGANLGPAWIEFDLPGAAVRGYAGWQHQFQIQEFRTPDFEVTARQQTPPPFYTAAPATVAVDAEYFAGGPLPGAEVDWQVTTRSTTYSPPNWDDYTFGIWQPWWFGGFDTGFEGDFGDDIAFESGSDECFDCRPGLGDERVERFSGRTDAAGSHYLQIAFEGPEVDLPSTVTAEATVTDVNRQAFADRTDLLVHPARYYVGLRSDRTFVEQGTPLRIDAVLSDVDGELVAGREFEVSAGRLEWVFENGQWSEQVADTQTCAVTSSADAADGSMRCEFTTDIGGTYRISGTVVDDDGGRNRSELTQWVSGGEGRPSRGVQQEQVTIVPDRETYEPGDTAELLVQAPFAPASGLLTVIRGGIESATTFVAPDGSAVVTVPITEDQIPNVTVQVDMTGATDRINDDGTPVVDAPQRPAFANGLINLSIPPITRALDVTATPADRQASPGADTSVTVQVNDADGSPVSGAEVAIVVVDEAVLSLTGFDLADPLDVFYRDIRSLVSSEYLRSSILLGRPDLLSSNQGEGDDAAAGSALDAPTEFAEESDAAEATAADGDDGGDTARNRSAIDLRSDFDALAVYAPDESTADDGTVTVDVPLPDNLTRYRVMAVAINGADEFGKGESTITARLPLMVRPSAPRFLNFGDRFELPIVVQNQTDDEMVVDLVVAATNLTLGDDAATASRRVTVPANDRVEVRFPAAAAEVGTARIRVAGVSGDMADAAAVELPVYTPATAEAFATYGIIDDGAIAQPVVAPNGVIPQFGGLEINTSSTAVQALTDAVLYLYEYRYSSADAFASRIMAVAALRDVLSAFDADGLPDEDELNAVVQRDVNRLSAMQNEDGGFPYWQRGRQSIPWQSIQSTHALVLAEDAGYDVDADVLERALTHLGSIEDFIPSDYPESVRQTLGAYALHVRHLGGDTDASKALGLYRRVGDSLELDALAWLWPIIDDTEARDEIERRFLNAATETAGAATFATGYGEDAYVIAHSDRRTDGIILDALVSEVPDSDLIPKVVAGLLGNQTRGRWNNAHENAFILLAMNRYFTTFEAVTPDFVARAWLGDLYAAEHVYSGRSIDRSATVVPMGELIAAGDTDVVVSKDGDGRLYYRLGLRYAPADLQLDARDEGFVVERTYEAVDDADDVRLDDDGVWRVKAGASVRVRVTMVADARRTHVALIDPMPAGLEPVNPALVTSPTPLPENPNDSADADSAGWCWCWRWFEHQNLRDDRAEAFTSFLPGGTYEYSYVARATTPGEFVVPPARAEEIYAPEVFGRSGSTTLVVE